MRMYTEFVRGSIISVRSFFMQKMSSRSSALIQELIVRQRSVRKFSITVPEWLPTAANFLSGRESRSWDPGDLNIRSQGRRKFLSSYAQLDVPSDGTCA